MATPVSAPAGWASLRDAAFELFAAQGVETVSLRAIAARAGVTAGLVKHHFGGKEGLVAEVDAHVIGLCASALADAMEHLDTEQRGASPIVGVVTAIQQSMRESKNLRGYIARRMASDDSAGQELFRQFVGIVNDGLVQLREAGLVREDVEPFGAMVLLVDMILGPIVLARQWTAFAGIDSFDPSLAEPAEFVHDQVLRGGLFVDPA